MKIGVRVVDETIETKLPIKAHSSDAGFDIFATKVSYDVATGCVVCNTNLAINIPNGYVGMLYPRSSICKYPLRLTNSVGVLDSGYVGEILFKFKMESNHSTSSAYKVGDRIGQLIVIPIPEVELCFVDSFEQTLRDVHGFGSTGA